MAAPVAGGNDLVFKRQQMIQDLANLQFDRLGNPVLRWDHIPKVTAPKADPHRLLVVLVEFQDVQFDRFKGEPDRGAKLAAYYQDTLFDPNYERVGTLSHYFHNQSLGSYHLQGTVLKPFTVSKPRAEYGRPMRPAGGSWRNDSDTESMVEEVFQGVMAQHPDLDWASFDRWDPADFDGDGVLAESDGYLDHFVLVYAGGGQSSCQRLYKIDDVLNPNVGEEALATLTPAARECAERIWPHRFLVQKRTAEGPVVEGFLNARGGVPIHAGLWGRDYNMQSEYTDTSTFIHEFGHSIGLPDIYARTSYNSTGGWELMSATAQPLPQSLSAWSRMMLGWLTPHVIMPPEGHGKPVQSSYLTILDTPSAGVEEELSRQKAGLNRAVLVVLPPKTIEIDLGGLPKSSQAKAVYSGQGNELSRNLEIRLDLQKDSGPVELSFDALWEIEAGWDFAYLESSIDGGKTWVRRVTADRRYMPAKHGHDGADQLPGFTGLSGDFDGDGKNETAKGCDPKKAVAHGDDKNAEHDPCRVPTWTRPTFRLDDLAGHSARIRLRYFTDMAAVERGILIDNVIVKVGDKKGGQVVLNESFEGELSPSIRLNDFVLSEGKHSLLVPHFYLAEVRDPYAQTTGGHRYDTSLADPALAFYAHPTTGKMMAVATRYRPGVLLWVYDGAFAWSENDPATTGQGRGFLLAVDAWPNEVQLPGFESWFLGDPRLFDTGYDVQSDPAQQSIQNSIHQTFCFVRNQSYRPTEAGLLPQNGCAAETAAIDALSYGGKKLKYGYEIYNEILPGPNRDALKSAGELVDYRLRDGKVAFRMRDSSLRYMHTADSPLALEPFANQIEIFEVDGTTLRSVESRTSEPISRFENFPKSRWANPRLYFGGVSTPNVPVAIELAKPDAGAPAGSVFKLYVRWNP